MSVRNTSGSSRSVTLTGSLSSNNGTAFSYPELPSRTVTVAARSTATVTVGPVAWNLDSTSYWWPNVPYRSGYRAQLHGLTVHAVTDDGHTSDATYRFGFREATQNGDVLLPQRRARELPRRQPPGCRLRPDQQRRQGRRVRHPARLPAPVVRQRRLAAGGGQLPAAELQRGAHPPGAREPVHVGCRRRDGPDDHRRDRDSRLHSRAGLDRRARQHGQPRPCAGPARPQPPRGHPLESDQRAEPERPGFRTVREGPVRGDERRRRHPADHCRGGRRRRMSACIPG